MEIEFGYMGSGLIPKGNGSTCSFLSKGLELGVDENNKIYILSYHNRI
jgi:hypothetical protein